MTQKNCGNCVNLDYLEDINLDGYVNECNSGYVCNERPGLANLKGFPFRSIPKSCIDKGHFKEKKV